MCENFQAIKFTLDNIPMSQHAKIIKNRLDYQLPPYHIDTVHLTFDLTQEDVHVIAELHISPMPSGLGKPLVLDGEDITLIGLWLNKQPCTTYQTTDVSLTLPSPPKTPFILTLYTQFNPQKNTALSGLYYTGGNYCTQCEAEGFRRITYFLDRPDVLSVFTTTIQADKERFPHLLSNGNCIETTETDTLKTVTWHDPHPKPCYLFALVAGNFDTLEDTFTTQEGRVVQLQFFIEKGLVSQAQHALNALKKAMQWDEDTYGLSYDLDHYMVVAVSDFNMGAMENKGLNIFNTKYVLADQQTAADADYLNIEAVIGHEYFHNWSGNRVTCRDWFQLSLKEGFTVFREHQFTAFCSSPPVQRIDEVNVLRSRQFPEDQGPMAHPVRPDSYLEINNFYTMTVYHKGAEVIRMMKILLGDEKFYAGVALYFKRHDGQAVTCDDFVKALEDASKTDLTAFKQWYAEAGTPHVKVVPEYQNNQFSLHCTQSEPPFTFPLTVALLDTQGQLQVPETVCVMNQTQQTFAWPVADKPIPSLLRGFSAPIILEYPYTLEERLTLLEHDTDAFAQWEAAQQLLSAYCLNQSPPPLDLLLNALCRVLQNQTLEPALMARLLEFPTLSYLSVQLNPFPLERTLKRRREAELQFARLAEPVLQARYTQKSDTPGERALKNKCLYYLAFLGNDTLVQTQYDTAPNMTLRLGALCAINDQNSPLRAPLFQDFYQRFQQYPLVVDKWLALQARSHRTDTLKTVQTLLKHPAFQLKNPNKIYALIGGFGANLPAFHAPDGAGYAFLESQIAILDRLNPQVAARLTHAFTELHQYDESRQVNMRQSLQRLSTQKLSNDVREIVEKTLTGIQS
jgi:aminopeptidase N